MFLFIQTQYPVLNEAVPRRPIRDGAYPMSLSNLQECFLFEWGNHKIASEMQGPFAESICTTPFQTLYC